MTKRYRKPLEAITAHIDGRPYRLERVRLDDLGDWFERHNLRPAGTTQGFANDWPLFLSERNDDNAPDQP